MRANRLTDRLLTATVVTTVLLTGCAGSDGVDDVLTSGGDGPAYRCAGLSIAPDDLATAPPASELSAEGRTALDGGLLEGFEPEIDLDDGWLVVEDGSDHITLLRELDEPQDLGGGDIHTHEVLAIQRGATATDARGDGWVLDLVGTCALRVEGPPSAGPVGDADLALAGEPDPAVSEVELFVTERECASGQPADGRIELLELEETDTEVRVHIGVRSQPGDQDCPSNPPTPFTVELSEPLGDRTVVDVATVPPRVLEVGLTDEGPVEEPQGPVDDATVEAALSWQPPTSYVLELETVCFCPENLHRVTVRDGEVVSREVVGEDGTVVGTADAYLAPSLTELQDRISNTGPTDDGGALVDLTVDAATGAIETVEFDPVPEAVDDEIGYVVLELTVTG